SPTYSARWRRQWIVAPNGAKQRPAPATSRSSTNSAELHILPRRPGRPLQPARFDREARAMSGQRDVADEAIGGFGVLHDPRQGQSLRQLVLQRAKGALRTDRAPAANRPEYAPRQLRQHPIWVRLFLPPISPAFGVRK